MGSRRLCRCLNAQAQQKAIRVVCSVQKAGGGSFVGWDPSLAFLNLLAFPKTLPNTLYDV